MTTYFGNFTSCENGYRLENRRLNDFYVEGRKKTESLKWMQSGECHNEKKNIINSVDQTAKLEIAKMDFDWMWNSVRSYDRSKRIALALWPILRCHRYVFIFFSLLLYMNLTSAEWTQPILTNISRLIWFKHLQTHWFTAHGLTNTSTHSTLRQPQTIVLSERNVCQFANNDVSLGKHTKTQHRSGEKKRKSKKKTFTWNKYSKRVHG